MTTEFYSQLDASGKVLRTAILTDDAGRFSTVRDGCTDAIIHRMSPDSPRIEAIRGGLDGWEPWPKKAEEPCNDCGDPADYLDPDGKFRCAKCSAYCEGLG